MRQVLNLIKNISFGVLLAILFLLLFTGNIDFETVKGNVQRQVRPEEVHTDFEDTYLFNELFGRSLIDIVTYGSKDYAKSFLKERKVPKENESISANELHIDTKDLDTNEYEARYKSGETNINFMIVSKLGNKEHVFTNVESKGTSAKKADIEKKIKEQSGKYVDYNFAENKLDTNTRIEADTMYKIVDKNRSLYGDDIRVLVGLNKDTSKIDDDYKRADDTFTQYTQYFWAKILLAIVCAFIYLALTIYLIAYEAGKDIKPKVTDSIPFEIRVLLLAIAVTPYTFIFDRGHIIDGLTSAFGSALYAALAVFVIGLITDMIIGFFLFGAIRRIKSGLIIRNSLIVKLIKWIWDKCLEIYKDRNNVFKAVVPLTILIVFNIFIVLADIIPSGLSIALLVAVDVFAIYIAYRSIKERSTILDVISKIAHGNISAKVDLNDQHADNLKMAEAVNQIGDAVNIAVEKSLKDEKMKADLITNVSHDLKTPLTSIINYVDLLKKEKIDNETAIGYINILDEKAQRLKQMTDDLVEVSKISSGNVVLNMERLNFKELLNQAVGEFADKFEEKSLTVVEKFPENGVYITADSRSMYRVIENLFTNIYKYALTNTRVYIDLDVNGEEACALIKNISANELNIKAEDLTERFIRGEESRTTEGSGLGLSIAKSLTEKMGGKFDITLDGDLFKVTLIFKTVN